MGNVSRRQGAPSVVKLGTLDRVEAMGQGRGAATPFDGVNGNKDGSHRNQTV
jgi:hypothetical protein